MPAEASTANDRALKPFRPDGLLAVTASASVPAKAASPTPTHGITVTPPAGSKIVTYSRTAAQISGRTEYFLDLRIANQTKRASLELRKGLLVCTWQGTLNNQPNVIQRIVLVLRLSPNGPLSLEIGSTTQKNVKIDLSKTVLGADPSFRSAALISLIIDYQAIAAGKTVKMSNSVLLSKCDISPARIVIDRIVPKQRRLARFRDYLPDSLFPLGVTGSEDRCSACSRRAPAMTSARRRRQFRRLQGRRHDRALAACVKTPITTAAVFSTSPRAANVAAACNVARAWDRSRRSGGNTIRLRTWMSASTQAIFSTDSEAACPTSDAARPIPQARSVLTSTGRA
jgi:hypothetical protein